MKNMEKEFSKNNTTTAESSENTEKNCKVCKLDC